MKRYTSQSNHEIGYKWEIDAPETLTMEDVEALQRLLCNYTDAPTNDILQDMLEDYYYYCDDLDTDKISEFKKVTIYVESVYRVAFAQDLKEY